MVRPAAIPTRAARAWRAPSRTRTRRAPQAWRPAAPASRRSSELVDPATCAVVGVLADPASVRLAALDDRLAFLAVLDSRGPRFTGGTLVTVLLAHGSADVQTARHEETHRVDRDIRARY